MVPVLLLKHRKAQKFRLRFLSDNNEMDNVDLGELNYSLEAGGQSQIGEGGKKQAEVEGEGTHGPPPPSRLAAPESAEPPVHSDMHSECINEDAEASDGGMGLQHKCDGCGHSFSTLKVLYIHASCSVYVCVAVCVIERESVCMDDAYTRAQS